MVQLVGAMPKGPEGIELSKWDRRERDQEQVREDRVKTVCGACPIITTSSGSIFRWRLGPSLPKQEIRGLAWWVELLPTELGLMGSAAKVEKLVAHLMHYRATLQEAPSPHEPRQGRDREQEMQPAMHGLAHKIREVPREGELGVERATEHLPTEIWIMRSSSRPLGLAVAQVEAGL